MNGCKTTGCVITVHIDGPDCGYLLSQGLKDGMKGVVVGDSPNGRLRIKFFAAPHSESYYVEKQHLTILRSEKPKGWSASSAIMPRLLQRTIDKINKEDSEIIDSYENNCREPDSLVDIDDFYMGGVPLNILFEIMGDQGNGASRYIQTITYKGEKLLCAR